MSDKKIYSNFKKFKEKYLEEFKYVHMKGYDHFAEMAFNAKDAEIEELKSKLNIAKDCVGFCADFKNSYDDLCNYREDNCIVGHCEMLRQRARSIYVELEKE
jgi:hypothetical protein